MYTIEDQNYNNHHQFENDENEFQKEKLAFSYLWHSPNLAWWWWSTLSSLTTTNALENNLHLSTYASTSNIFSTTTNSLSAAASEYKPFINLNSPVHYNQKVISENSQQQISWIISNDTFTTTKPNQQQQHNLATASLRIESFLNDTDYLCFIHSNPKTPNSTNSKQQQEQQQRQSSIVTRIAIRQKRRPLLLNCNSLELPVLLLYLKEQVTDYWYSSSRSHEQINQIKRTTTTINTNNSNQKSISVAADLGDVGVSLYCTAIRGALMVQFSWRDVKHGQLLGAISHTFVQPSIESNWRRTLNSSIINNNNNNNHPHHPNSNSNLFTAHQHQQFLNQQSPLTKNELNTQSNYTVRLHFNPKLPELITAELKLSKVNLDHFFTQFQCLVSNELGSDSAIYEIRKKNVPDQVNQVHVRHLSSNRLVLSWLPGFDGGFNQQYIVRFALKNELERAIHSKQLLANTHTMYDLQHPNSVHSSENLNEIRRLNTADENDVLVIEEEQQQENSERMNRENLKRNHNGKEQDEKSDANNNFGSGSTSSDMHWRTDQDRPHLKNIKSYSPHHPHPHPNSHHNSNKRKNLKKRINIRWNSILLSTNGVLAQIRNERLVSNETQVEFTDLKPSTEYYFTILSKNRLGLAKEHSIPILIRTAKADLNQESSATDQVQSNLQLGENSLGLIEHGLLTNSTARNLTFWLFVGGCTIVLVNAIAFTVYCYRQRTAKLIGSLTTTGSTSTASTNSTQCTTLSTLSNTLNIPQSKNLNNNNNKKDDSNPSKCDANQIESSNEKQTIISNENNEALLDNSLSKKLTKTDEHCIMNSNNDALLTNSNVTFTLMTNPLTTTSTLVSNTGCKMPPRLDWRRATTF